MPRRAGSRHHAQQQHNNRPVECGCFCSLCCQQHCCCRRHALSCAFICWSTPDKAGLGLLLRLGLLLLPRLEPRLHLPELGSLGVLSHRVLSGAPAHAHALQAVKGPLDAMLNALQPWGPLLLRPQQRSCPHTSSLRSRRNIQHSIFREGFAALGPSAVASSPALLLQSQCLRCHSGGGPTPEPDTTCRGFQPG